MKLLLEKGKVCQRGLRGILYTTHPSRRKFPASSTSLYSEQLWCTGKGTCSQRDPTAHSFQLYGNVHVVDLVYSCALIGRGALWSLNSRYLISTNIACSKTQGLVRVIAHLTGLTELGWCSGAELRFDDFPQEVRTHSNMTHHADYRAAHEMSFYYTWLNCFTMTIDLKCKRKGHERAVN